MSKREDAAWRLIEESFAIEAEEAAKAGKLAYMARVFAMTSLPYRDPGELPGWSRTNGALELVMQPGLQRDPAGALVSAGYPYGVIPRLLLAWISTEAVRTKERELVLGRSLSSFMRKLGMAPTGGAKRGNIGRLRDQTRRLLKARIATMWTLPNGGGVGEIEAHMDVAEEWRLWWDPKAPDVEGLLESSITLTPRFFNEMTQRPVPIDLRAVEALRRCAMRLDVYMWLTHRMSYLSRPTTVSWQQLRLQFGSTLADTPEGRAKFRSRFTEHLCRVQIVYPAANVDVTDRGLVLRPSATHVRRREAR